MKIIDATFSYVNGMTGMSKYHPTTEFVRLGKYEEIGRNTSSILLGSHIGTHMDSPRHFTADHYTIDCVPLEYCVGDVTLIDIRHLKRGDIIRIEDVDKYDLKERVLLVNGWYRNYGSSGWTDNYPYFSPECAMYLVNNGVKMIAMDTPSPDRMPVGDDTDYIIHRTLMPLDIILVECVANTDEIDFEKEYVFCALPLKLKDVDASPCRVILMEKE